MRIPSPVPNLTQEMACEATRLGDALTNAGIFLLMATLHFSDKRMVSRELRTAAVERRKSITDPLRVAGFEVRPLLRGLKDAGFVRITFKVRTFRCTADGDAVKHRYNALRLHLRVYRGYPQLGEESVADVDELRYFMRRVCEGKSLETP